MITKRTNEYLNRQFLKNVLTKYYYFEKDKIVMSKTTFNYYPYSSYAYYYKNYMVTYIDKSVRRILNEEPLEYLLASLDNWLSQPGYEKLLTRRKSVLRDEKIKEILDEKMYQM